MSIYKTKILGPGGKLKEIVTAEENTTNFWENFNGSVTDNSQKKAKRKIIKCQRCGSLYEARSTGARYCVDPEKSPTQQCLYLAVKEAKRKPSRTVMCARCNKKFSPVNSNQKWCNDPCTRQLQLKEDRAKRKKITATCRYKKCGVSFYKTKWNKVFCSKGCGDKYHLNKNYVPVAKRLNKTKGKI
tara:strand:+ start:18 stop:575 length:558 start_codon:yes stop_codon:yes gene_type:complete